MANDQADQYQQCVDKFIALANTMKDEGADTGLVSQAMMTASGAYATYAVAGNTGGLTQSGVDKIAELYKTNLENIQTAKKQELGQA